MRVFIKENKYIFIVIGSSLICYEVIINVINYQKRVEYRIMDRLEFDINV